MNTDYLCVGSGLSALVFGALMAKSGKRVTVLEAHEHPGGFGHTFTMAKRYKFNAQLHYVWDCEGDGSVHRVLQQLQLDQAVTFNRYDPQGFDHMRMPGYALDIPSASAELLRRLSALFPTATPELARFIDTVQKTSAGLKLLSPPRRLGEILQHLPEVFVTLRYLNSTLQAVFDQCKVPQAAQTLLALQWPDFLLPPEKLSFYAWVVLFTGYQRGAFYPTKHFEFVIDSLVKVIEDNGGQILFEHEVTRFLLKNKTVIGVEAINHQTRQRSDFFGNDVICNMDPKKAAGMIGLEHFSKSAQKQLNYEYSPSNFVAYCVVKDLDLRDYGFGEWNTFHSGHDDLNQSFRQMYENHDYSNPSFAITTPTLLTQAERDCPDGHQVIEFLTVANYDYFQQLKQSNKKEYRHKKEEILDAMLDVTEKLYIPNLRQHLVLKITGSPTTNEDFCGCPQGNSYGSSLTPANMGLGRLTHNSSLNNFYFCNASSGYPGFAPTFWTGAMLYQHLSGDRVLGKKS